jgi:20S proteasome alpha/beta subunit
MTLIIGVKCSDGIAIGSDGAATFGAMGQQTIRQSATKLHILRDCIVVGVSGSVGLAQRITGEILELYDTNKFSGKESYAAMKIIREGLWNHIGQELQIAGHAKNAIPPNAAILSAITQTLVAMPVKKNPCLFQFDQQGAPEEATKDLPFVAIGSGQSIADPFLAFLRRIFWSTTLPTLSDGLLATVWTLRHAIETNPGGVSDPIQIITLDKNGKARQIPEEELKEHLEAVDAAELALKNFRTQLSGGPALEKTIPLPE